ncbi:hypothetical protein LPB19_16105 [Marinobacter salinisoli]|uniref:Uncharacterized protein n=1 Tax=Marinobacter salinisoli TaxID=2769486 RepID=A0ABX7MQQ8_9GAMM|nr:hypothetical protein [Marinobacter salinisoli]QSP94672.1 hypothetical protein LPB19_16105 [Marinobacter salinisoli]
MSQDSDRSSPGTASPAKIRKAACGIRFADDELQEGIDFSGAADLKPTDSATAEERESAADESRQPDRHA